MRVIAVDKRDSLRDMVFLWNTPVCAPRIISGSAAWIAVTAAALSPEAIAASTFLMKVRMRDRRATFTSVRDAVWRIRFLADL